ncbi:MAG: hypothetical protein H0T46_25765 [Deltaproteobacteria bacterium]|nr:hypothetical protein [Deltaproteobacteria bacterium]
MFADLDVDPDGRVFLARISFDGYGCCGAPVDIRRMDLGDSEALLTMVKQGAVDARAAESLSAYFRQVCDVLWRDAFEHHGLI